MKTGMEWGLAALLLLIVAVVGWQAYDSAQMEMSVAKVNALASGSPLPAETIPLAELGTGWVLKALIGSVLAGAGAALVAKAWPLLKRRLVNDRRAWKPGPNAHFGKTPNGPRAPSMDELTRAWLLRQMMSESGKPTATPRVEFPHDEPAIRF